MSVPEHNNIQLRNEMKKNILAAALTLVVALPATAGGIFDNLTYYIRAGYAIGGTAPISMPAEIRKLYKYSVKPNITLALDAYKPLGGRWGLLAGFHYECKNMKTDADVKNYHMEMRQGGRTISGMFTGGVVTKVDEWMVTLPLQATCDLGKVRLKGGPYLSYVLSNSFSGYAYDGHIRMGDPTGNRVNIGSDDSSRGTYDFSDDLRHLQFGVDFGADWYFSQRWGAYADVAWGLTGIFNSDFKTIEQTLYPIYGTIGVTYRLK